MKVLNFFLVALFLFLSATAHSGQFNSGSTGADGAFSPTTSTEVQLPPDGIFNFTTVYIPSGITIKFKKNATNTPVHILATGNVTIAGTINIDGTLGTSIQPGVGGPGGNDGGFGGVQNGTGGKGIGPGGGTPVSYGTGGGGGGGGFGTVGSRGGSYGGLGGETYGNERIIPMIGGSGGGGGAGQNGTGGAGGGGGGAVLIASSGSVTVSGAITANGGNGVNAIYSGGGGGSGGAIRIIANTITGNGTISASGGSGGTGYDNGWRGGTGGSGRIRFEANIFSRTSGTTPGYTFSYPDSVFVANTPSLQIISIGGVNVPSSPSGSYATPDITLPTGTTNPVKVVLAASNIPVGTTVTVSLIPQFGSATNVNTTLNGTSSSSSATANVNLSTQYPYIITATTIFTIQTSMFHDGEKIDKVKVAANVGKESEVTYITESGKEIPAAVLMARKGK